MIILLIMNANDMSDNPPEVTIIFDFFPAAVNSSFLLWKNCETDEPLLQDCHIPLGDYSDFRILCWPINWNVMLASYLQWLPRLGALF